MEIDELLTKRPVLVTGGAGFIGSHLVDALMRSEVEVHVLDNLSSGNLENIKPWLKHPKFKFMRGDLLNPADVIKAVKGVGAVFHLAANPEVRLSSISPEVHFEQNLLATYNLLESIRKESGIEYVVFTSSSTVYGDASKIPTPEDYSPLEPISVYGASKLASESLICAYAHNYGFNAIIYRLANVIGTRSRHGVIYDFVRKIRENPQKLEILGDGTQSKSYLYVDDCIEGIILGYRSQRARLEVYNLGSSDWVSVATIARIVVEEMGLKDVSLQFTGGVEGGRGWKGDVKYMLLDTKKIRSLGWRPKLNSVEAVRKTVREILRESQ